MYSTATVRAPLLRVIGIWLASCAFLAACERPPEPPPQEGIYSCRWDCWDAVCVNNGGGSYCWTGEVGSKTLCAKSVKDATTKCEYTLSQGACAPMSRPHIEGALLIEEKAPCVTPSPPEQPIVPTAPKVAASSGVNSSGWISMENAITVAVDSGASDITVKVGDETVRSPVTRGELMMHALPGNLMRVSDMRLWGGDFKVSGKPVSDLFLQVIGEVQFTPDENGYFSVPPGGISFNLRATVDGELTALNRTTTETTRGFVDMSRRTIVFNLGMLGDGMSLELFVAAKITNFPPSAAVEENLTVECSSPAGGVVHLDGTASQDPDGQSDIVSYKWSIHRDASTALLGGGVKLDVVLPLGRHEIVLTTTDRAGAYSRSRQLVVNVQDSTPPQIVDFYQSGPVCLWPPSHKYAVLNVGKEFQAVIKDACDPNARFVIRDAVSDQPDNAQGDGNTVNDVVFSEDHVCLRSERQGGDADGRTYRIVLAAIDGAGNRSELSVPLRVAHDQSQHDCPKLEVSEFVEDGDPRCAVSSAPPVQPATGPEKAATGCATAGPNSANTPWACIIVLLVLSVWRRGARRAAGNRALRVSGGGGLHSKKERADMGRVFLVLICGLSVGCGSSADLSSEHCFEGWWNGLATSCRLACMSQDAPAECRAADCQEQSYVAFLAGGQQLSGSYVVSQSMRELTHLGVPSQGTWTGTQSSNLEVRDAQGRRSTFSISCRGSELSIDGSIHVRPPAEIEGALNSAWDEQNFSEISF